MDKNGQQKWREMLVLVENPNFVPGLNEELIPAAFVAVAGEKTPTKLHLANRMLVDWQVCFKKTRVTKRINVRSIKLVRKITTCVLFLE